MIDILIWSKDRACQLDLLLRSIKKNLPNFSSCNIYVIYKYSSKSFQEGYKLIAEKHNVAMIEEVNFYDDTIHILQNPNPYIMFLADDNVFYRYNNISPVTIIETMINNNACCFSLRLGMNTVVQCCYTNLMSDIPKNFYKIEPDILMWEWRLCHRYHNFGYPFALDAHIYNKQEVLQGLNFYFKNTTELEGNYCQKVEHFKPHMCCLEQSTSVNNPTNVVSQSGLPCSKKHGNTLEFLNKQFINGKCVNIDKIEKEKIIGCHQEIRTFWNES